MKLIPIFSFDSLEDGGKEDLQKSQSVCLKHLESEEEDVESNHHHHVGFHVFPLSRL